MAELVGDLSWCLSGALENRVVPSTETGTDLDYTVRAFARRLHRSGAQNGGHSGASQRILGAYAQLRDPAARINYDRHRAAAIRDTERSRTWFRDLTVRIDPVGEPVIGLARCTTGSPIQGPARLRRREFGRTATDDGRVASADPSSHHALRAVVDLRDIYDRPVDALRMMLVADGLRRPTEELRGRRVVLAVVEHQIAASGTG